MAGKWQEFVFSQSVGVTQQQQTNEDTKIIMSNAEETPESSLKRGSFVDEFLESGRKKAKTSLSTQDDKHIKDLEYILKSVKALVKIIQEIWDNCKDHLLTSTENCESPFTFERYVYEKARVEKNGRHLTITTQKVSNEKDFGNPPAVPANLGEMINVGQAQAIPDYNKYLEKSSILCKDVLLPFLTGLKEHLENVQVYLGQIEAWLLEIEDVFSFLKKTFNGPGCLRMRDKEDLCKFCIYGSYCLDVDSEMKSIYDLCTKVGRDRLKITMNYMKIYQPVTQIEVKGAGEKAVNGTYTLKGRLNGVYYYQHSGLWDGKPVIYSLAPRKLISDDSIMWCIYCKCENQRGSTKFYWTKVTEEEYELPPLNGWNMEGNNLHGVNPPPQILYKIDD